MAEDMGLDELRRRLLAGQSNPSGPASENGVWIDPSGGIRRGAESPDSEVLSQVPKKVFA